MSHLSRRSFSKLIGVGAAYAALRPADQLKASTSLPPAGNEIVRLSSNENPYGPSPASLKAMTDAFNLAWRYPDEYADVLIDELTKLHNVATNQILLGAGSGRS